MNYKPTEILQVDLALEGGYIPVGRLALSHKQIWFEYDNDFIAWQLELSPFHLPLEIGAKRSKDMAFLGLFGLFDDSLPDGWGRLLLDRQLNAHNISPDKLTPLDRLAHVGKNGMGALSYQPEIVTEHHLHEEINLEKLADESHLMLEGDSHTFFEELLEMNGSSNGARPKIVASVSADKKHIRSNVKSLPEDYSHWIIKFSSSLDLQDIGAIEFAYSNMAREAGIEMSETFLFPKQKSGGYFGSKRFDRLGDKRIHMHTLCGLLHADYRIPNLDYVAFIKATYLLTKDIKEAEKAYRFAVFNVLAHNRDDHSKNFAFLMDDKGLWRLAPAFDLTYSHGPQGEQSMTVLGEGKNPGIPHLLKLAEKCGIKYAEDIVEGVCASVLKWNIFAEEAGVTRLSKEKIKNNLISK